MRIWRCREPACPTDTFSEVDIAVAVIGAVAVIVGALIAAAFGSMIGPWWTRHLDKKDFRSALEKRCDEQSC
jgi:hypothetical protein